jgi:hypothetical protein
MPTPARGPQTTRREGVRKISHLARSFAPRAFPSPAQQSARLSPSASHGASSRLPAPTTPRHALARVLYDWMAEPQREAQRRSVLSDSRQPPCRGRRGRREPRFLCSRAVLLCMRTRSPDRRLGAHPVVTAGRRTWAPRVGSHGTFPATSVARAASFDVGCSASGYVKYDRTHPNGYGMPYHCMIPYRSGMPRRVGIPCRCGIPC